MMRFFLSVVLAGAALADSEPYTIGQVAHGYGHGLVSGYGAIGNRGYAGYGGLYGGYRGYYGKREADSDAYTIGQVALGLPVANAYATGHPHNNWSHHWSGLLRIRRLCWIRRLPSWIL